MPKTPLAVATLVVVLAACESPVQLPTPDAGAPAPPVGEPEDVVRLHAGARAVLFRGPAEVKPECFGGHKGFRASAADDLLSLNAFVLQPGTYRCDDSSPVIYFFWRGREADQDFEVQPDEPTGGSCELVVSAVHPRMKATFTARLPRRQQSGPEEVELAGELDIAMRDRSCP